MGLAPQWQVWYMAEAYPLGPAYGNDLLVARLPCLTQLIRGMPRPCRATTVPLPCCLGRRPKAASTDGGAY